MAGVSWLRVSCVPLALVVQEENADLWPLGWDSTPHCVAWVTTGPSAWRGEGTP